MDGGILSSRAGSEDEAQQQLIIVIDLFRNYFPKETTVHI